MMQFEFDPAKDASNLAKHGWSLAQVAEMQVVAVVMDRRFDFERRYRWYGFVDGYRACAALTLRDGVVRAISLRRAHEKEFRRHVR